MNRREIAQVLSEIAAILEIKGENPFKIRAYENAARTVDSLSNLEELIEAKKLTTIKGIGKNLADHITELYKTGRLKDYAKLRKSIPDGLLEMLNIPGVGAKKVKVFWEKLDITNVGELEYACKENRLRDLPGFGQKSLIGILKNIPFLNGSGVHANCQPAEMRPSLQRTIVHAGSMSLSECSGDRHLNMSGQHLHLKELSIRRMTR